MKTAIATLTSVSPYSQSRFHDTPKLENEPSDKYRERTWRNHLHTDDKGMVFIPPMTFKNALGEAAKYLGKTVPGKGKATYTKYFDSGVMVLEPVQTGIKASEVQSENLFLPSDGIRGSGKRVMKTYPIIPKWTAKVRFTILNDMLTENVFEEHLKIAGQYIGIGRFRPIKNGYYGRYAVESVKWE